MKRFRLERCKQCTKCPWKISTDPYEIPNGYSHQAHLDLAKTIATDLDDTSKQLKALNEPLKVMTCHETDESYCIGWLYNQLGEGNNVPLRIQMMLCSNINEIEIDGEQHQTFADTLPKTKSIQPLDTQD